MLGFLQRHVEPREARLAGNSVHVDLGFLRVHMPDLAAHLHYRIVDVSSVAELCARWFPTEYKRAPRKKVGSCLGCFDFSAYDSTSASAVTCTMLSGQSCVRGFPNKASIQSIRKALFFQQNHYDSGAIMWRGKR